MSMLDPTFGIPQKGLPVADKDGIIGDGWYRFLLRLAQLTPERVISPVAVGDSPFEYQATTIGNLLITGGTVSAISLTRGNVTVDCTTNPRFVPMTAKDIVTITYSVLPTINFVPGARA